MAETATRRLSAIMFTDMAGYTALVQKDEPLARRNRDRWRAVLTHHTDRNGGRILQFFGDGALSVYDSAIAAVTSGVAIQQELSREPRVPLRIGIHTGDVVHDEEGVFGDGVNIASRIQNLCPPGAVLISAKVWDELKNQPHLPALSLGEFSLKNVQRPVEVFALSVDGVLVPDPTRLEGRTTATRRAVAVLPFVNLSADPENEFFSDGMTEELINLLTRLGSVRVTARTSSFAFKGRQQDVREIASALGVQMVLEGSVRRASDRVRVTAQLIDASSGYHLFSETYDRRLADIFDLQDDIARAIVDTLQARLEPRIEGSPWVSRLERLDAYLASTRTTTEAHALYLHGLHEYNKWTPEAVRRGIGLFEQCIAADPDYAPAHAALARAHGLRASTGQARSDTSWAAAERAAHRAVELDPTLGDGHIALATVDLFHHWNIDAARQHLDAALTLNPGSALAHQTFAIYLIVIGEPERAIEETQLAARMDPLSMLSLYSVTWALVEAERYDEAVAICDRILETDPMFRAAHEGKGYALMRMGRFEAAAREFERITEITGDPYKGLAPRGANLARMGRVDEARQALRMLHERVEHHPDLSLEFDFVTLHAALGEYDEAFHYLRAAATRRLAEVLFSVNSPLWRELRADERYWEIVRPYGLDRIATRQ